MAGHFRPCAYLKYERVHGTTGRTEKKEPAVGNQCGVITNSTSYAHAGTHACVCVSSPLLHIEYQYPHSSSKIGPCLQSGAILLGPTMSEDCVRVKPGFRVELGVGFKSGLELMSILCL